MTRIQGGVVNNVDDVFTIQGQTYSAESLMLSLSVEKRSIVTNQLQNLRNKLMAQQNNMERLSKALQELNKFAPPAVDQNTRIPATRLEMYRIQKDKAWGNWFNCVCEGVGKAGVWSLKVGLKFGKFVALECIDPKNTLGLKDNQQTRRSEGDAYWNPYFKKLRQLNKTKEKYEEQYNQELQTVQNGQDSPYSFVKTLREFGVDLPLGPCKRGKEALSENDWKDYMISKGHMSASEHSNAATISGVEFERIKSDAKIKLQDMNDQVQETMAILKRMLEKSDKEMNRVDRTLKDSNETREKAIR